MHLQSFCHLTVDGVEERGELIVTVPLRALADHRTGDHVERCLPARVGLEQRRRALRVDLARGRPVPCDEIFEVTRNALQRCRRPRGATEHDGPLNCGHDGG